MRPCPACEKLQPDLASTCSNCGQALAPPTGAMLVDPVLELRATLQQRDQELAAATAKIAEVQRQADARESELRRQADARAAANEADARASANERVPAKTDASDQVAPAWGSAVLARLLRRWPRSSTLGAAVLAAGTAFGGWELVWRFLSGETAAPPPAAVTTAGETDAAAAVIKERDDLRAQLSTAAKEREQLAAQAGTAIKERDQVRAEMTGAVQERDTLRTRVAGMESQVATATKDLAAANAARDQALVREKTALTRAGGDRPPVRAGVSAGFVDFIVPSGPDESDIVLQRGQAPVLSGGAWPSGDCTVIVGDPEARFKGVAADVVGPRKRFRTTMLPGPCNASAIIVKKSAQWDGGDVVRLFWQLR